MPQIDKILPWQLAYVESFRYIYCPSKSCVMNWLKQFFKTKAFALTVSKGQKELLEFFISNRADFDAWIKTQPQSNTRFQFYYPNAIDLYYGEFKLFTAYFKKDRREQLNLLELKMTETNFDTIRCASWRPFEEVIIEFLTSLEENKKVALFEKRKMLYEYENLCAKKAVTDTAAGEYPGNITSLLTR